MSKQSSMLDNEKSKQKSKKKIILDSVLVLILVIGAILVASQFAPRDSFLGSINDKLSRFYNHSVEEPIKKHEAEKNAQNDGSSSNSGVGVTGANGDKATEEPKSYVLDNPAGNAGNKDGGVVTFTNPTSMGRYIVPQGDPLKTGFPVGSVVDYAPEPNQSFRNAQCSTAAKHEADPGGNNSWTIPSVHASAPYTITGEGSLPMSLPNAPAGTENADTARIGDTSGSILQLGHVNEPSGAVSPWGYLHRVSACDHVYQRGTDGKVHEYVITDLYTVPQKDFVKEADVWRAKGNGPAKLFMATCSGTTVRDDGSHNAGGTLYFNYQNNLIVGAVPVQ